MATTVSSEPSATRLRLLEAARRILETDGPHGAGMEQIARAAGVTRQSAYLHFGSKSGLLLALVAHVDGQRDVNALVDRLWRLPSPLAALDAVAGLAAATNPEVHRIGMALDAARRWDEAFQDAWADRMERRRDRYRRLARWLESDGVLGDGWTVERATQALCALTSLQTYDQLVVEGGMPPDDYAALLRSALTALTSPWREG